MVESNKHSEKIRVKIVRDIEGLEPYADDWNRLALHASQRTPALSYAYVASYFEHFLEPGESWFCMMALEGDNLLGVFPVVVTPARYLAFDRPLLRAPFNLHVVSVDFLTEDGFASQILPLLIDGLKNNYKKYMAVELLRISSRSPTLPFLADHARGSTVIKEFNGQGAFLDTTGSFDDFRATFSRKFKSNLNLSRNRISQLPDVKTIFLSGPEAGKDQIDAFLKVEAAGWKGQAGTAILSSPSLRAFYAALADRLSKLGWLEWHILSTENRPIAMYFAIKMGKTLVLTKIGYDEEFRRYSPAIFLTEQTIRRAFESKDTDQIDFLSDASWLDNWKLNKRDYYDLWIYPNRPIPFIYGILPKNIRRLGRRVPVLKSTYKRIRSVIRRG